MWRRPKQVTARPSRSGWSQSFQVKVRGTGSARMTRRDDLALRAVQHDVGSELASSRLGGGVPGPTLVGFERRRSGWCLLGGRPWMQHVGHGRLRMGSSVSRR